MANPLHLPLILLASALLGACAAHGDVAPPATAEDPETEFASRISAFIDELRAVPGAPAGFGVVIVRGDEVVFERAYGTRDIRTGAPMTLDTPAYTASTSKAYTGLLAAELDRDGTLPLDTTLADVWPGMTLPDPFDPSEITAEQLLSHSAGIINSGLMFLSNTAGTIGPADVPGHLARYTEPTGGAFTYSNFGPFLYSMMVEQRLGADWREVMHERVYAPLGLERTAASLAGFAPDEIAYCHRHRTGGWETVDPKPESTLNAAGGIYTSTRDAGRLLIAFAGTGRPSEGALSAGTLADTWRSRVDQDREVWGLQRIGYGLGWDIGRYGEAPIVFRAGGYPGCGAIFAFFPDQRLGIALLTLGDLAVGTFDSAILRQAYDFHTSDPEAAANAAVRLDQFAEAAASARREAAVAVDTVDRVAMSPARLSGFAGRFHNPRLGSFVVTAGDGVLQAALGDFVIELIPTGGDSFAGSHELFDAGSEIFTYRRDASGAIDALMWGQREFLRVAAGG